MIDPSTIIRARREMTASHPRFERNEEDAAEGGCGVVGLACEVPVAGRHLFDSLEQMRNRGNGKGGGVAMVAGCPSVRSRRDNTREFLPVLRRLSQLRSP